MLGSSISENKKYGGRFVKAEMDMYRKFGDSWYITGLQQTRLRRQVGLAVRALNPGVSDATRKHFKRRVAFTIRDVRIRNAPNSLKTHPHLTADSHFSQLLKNVGGPASKEREPIGLSAECEMGYKLPADTSIKGLLDFLKLRPSSLPQLSDIELAGRRFNDLTAQVERLGRLFDLTNSPSVRSKLLRTEYKVAEAARQFWVFFQDTLSVPSTGSPYNKNKMDSAMEDCFGSLQKVGSGVFRYEEICIEVNSAESANKVFSLYLARKCLCPKPHSAKAEALEGFYHRVTTARPPHPDRERATTLLRLLCEVLFTRKSYREFRETFDDVPLHRAGCVETPRSKGGKRNYLYNGPEDQTFLDGVVIPEAIYTGGKIRVITKDSALNCKLYSHFNKYMANVLRTLPCMIFGRTVKEWLEENEDFLFSEEGAEYLSGDLESATDLFDGEFARIVIDHLVTISDMSPEDAARMKGFTTDARLGLAGLVQLAGQLMGSILSFPILCLVSLMTLVIGTDLEDWLREDPRRIWILRGFGINGDDVVAKVRDGGAAWLNGVAAVGGVASRGKSLKSAVMFTVNSEIWYNDPVRGWQAPSSVRPSLVLAISDGRRAYPDRLWDEYSRSPFVDLKKFDPRKRLMVRLPPSMGGTGQLKEFNLREVLGWKIRRDLIPKMPMVRPQRYWEDLDSSIWNESKVSIALSPADAEAVKRIELSPFRGRPCWKEENPTPLMNVDAEVERQLKWITKEERELLRREWEYRWDLHERGLKVIKVPASLYQSLYPYVPMVRSKHAIREIPAYKGGRGPELSSVGHPPPEDWLSSGPIRARSSARAAHWFDDPSDRLVYDHNRLLRKVDLLPMELREEIGSYLIEPIGPLPSFDRGPCGDESSSMGLWRKAKSKYQLVNVVSEREKDTPGTEGQTYLTCNLRRMHELDIVHD